LGLGLVIRSVSFLVDLLLRLLYLFLDHIGLAAIRVILAATRMACALLLRLVLLVFVHLHALNERQDVHELPLLIVVEVARVRLVVLSILVEEHAFATLTIAFEQVEALFGHFVVDTVDLAGA